MAVVKAQRAFLAVHAAAVPEFLAALQVCGLVELIEPDSWPVEEGGLGLAQPYGSRGFDTEGEAGTLRRCLSFLETHAPGPGGLKSLFSEKPALSLQGLGEAFRKFPLEEASEKILAAESELHQISTEGARVAQFADGLEPWRDVDVRLSDLDGLRSVEVTLAEGSPGSRRRLMLALAEAADRVHTESVSSDHRGERFLVASLSGDEEMVETAFRQAGIAVAEKPEAPLGTDESPVDWGATPAEILARLEERRRGLGVERQKVLDGVGELAFYRPGLQAASDYADILRARREAEGYFVRVGDTALAMGWVLENQKDALRARLAKEIPHLHLEFLEHSPEDSPPVQLENAAAIRPFSVLTRLYGLPKPTEFDPTPLLAPFFFVFYGLCLTDSGYGIVIALLFWLAFQRVRLGAGAKDFLMLLALGGLSASFFGVFVGSWFGNFLEILPRTLGFLKGWADAAVVLDPIKNPVPFLILSLALGVIQIYVGLAAKLVARWKFSGLREALLEEGVEVFLLSGFLFAGLAWGGVFPPSVIPFAGWTALAAA
ncbi:MAG: V-type ATP synthase subunit I, partial [Acidobacteriota bacterium]